MPFISQSAGMPLTTSQVPVQAPLSRSTGLLAEQQPAATAAQLAAAEQPIIAQPAPDEDLASGGNHDEPAIQSPSPTPSPAHKQARRRSPQVGDINQLLCFLRLPSS